MPSYLSTQTKFLATRFISILLTLVIMPMASAQTAYINNYTEKAYKTKEVHGAVEMRTFGDDENRVYLFVPANPRPKGEVSTIFFHHGWQGMNPMNFGGLIDHLVRSGHVVIFPTYQTGDSTPPSEITKNAGQANRIALNHLAKEFSLIPKQGQTLYYGFSIGAGISVNLALNYNEYGLPPPDALFLVAPGDAQHVNEGRMPTSIYGSLESLPTRLPIVIMAGEDDDIGLPTARKLSARLCHIPRAHRIMYTVPTSQHAGRRVMSGHGSPGAPDSRYNFNLRQQYPANILQGRNSYEPSASLNQLDFFGYWKMLDGLLAGLKSKQFNEVVFGMGTPEQLSLGRWADGTELNPLKIEEFCTPK